MSTKLIICLEHSKKGNSIKPDQQKESVANQTASPLALTLKEGIEVHFRKIHSAAGYDDEFYFSRFFRKQTGVSPQAFHNAIGL